MIRNSLRTAAMLVFCTAHVAVAQSPLETVPGKTPATAHSGTGPDKGLPGKLPLAPGVVPVVTPETLTDQQKERLAALIERRNAAEKAIELLEAGTSEATEATLSAIDVAVAELEKERQELEWTNWRAQVVPAFLEDMAARGFDLPAQKIKPKIEPEIYLPLNRMLAYRNVNFENDPSPRGLTPDVPVLKLHDVPRTGISLVWIYQQGPFYVNTGQIALAGGDQ